MTKKFQAISAIVFSIVFVYPVLPLHSTDQPEKNAFQWSHFEKSLKTLDGHKISVLAQAKVVIIDPEIFSTSVFSVEGARTRLNEIIVPALYTAIRTHNKHELTASDNNSKSGVEINKEILTWINNFYGEYPPKFGMQIIGMKISLK